WLSIDPIALYNPVQETEHYIDGQHNGGYFNPRNTSVYGYCYLNPVLYLDPNGKQAEFDGWTSYGDKSSPAIQDVPLEDMQRRDMVFAGVVLAPAAVVAVSTVGVKATATWLFQEVAEYGFEKFTGIPILFGVDDIL
ncbi:hypothetical protein, partial [Candidatus Albibeggiatoa sp. nov. NOAA]|uniref:hypothetical protein n=1 Tax=Candidatus Albibeggiatoa sp. nov. NOAA TaxID=3162724 RepID=UPI0032F168DC|nr:hypothetical protein [Thiotrichaceae bacterium]